MKSGRGRSYLAVSGWSFCLRGISSVLSNVRPNDHLTNDAVCLMGGAQPSTFHSFRDDLHTRAYDTPAATPRDTTAPLPTQSRAQNHVLTWIKEHNEAAIPF
ncbi:hypothetical protein E2C01_061752 [Portunus trituberculatus]|uniref:Uncharacterized protein n=1 Tax=Portunus trituberculatus TaxID=210409 RepID=A0A5B7HC33_PORTR|nr:hypothetical protein [Portunus trituberculatus]